MNITVNKFIDYIQKESLFTPKDPLLLAVSGGVDSVVLVDLCERAGFRYAIAHCNFQLRGEESERDEAAVRKLALSYKRDIHVKHFDTAAFALEQKLSIQVAARKLRYAWFQELISASGAWLLTAHHADDNVETVLMNLFKGTGISGLRGILPKKERIIRPLLFARKAELLEYAQAAQLPYVEDSSNASDKYTRNFFRLEIIPAVEKVFPQAMANLAEAIPRFREVDMLYAQAIERHKKTLMTVTDGVLQIPVLKLAKSIPLHSIVYELFRPFGFTPHQVPDIIGLLQAETGKQVSSATTRILRHRNWLIITALEQPDNPVRLIENGNAVVTFGAGKLVLTTVPAATYQLSTAQHIAQLDASRIRFPLLLRKYKTGDYFYPLGMPKKKKVGRFLSGQKRSAVQKENTWVIESDKKILWVVGQRIDDRFKIKPSTSTVLRITFEAS